MITIKWNTKQWHDTGEELRRWKRMDVPQFVKYRARILDRDLMKWTPPRGRNPGAESWASKKKRGEKTLERDIRKVFTPIDQMGIYKNPTNPALGKALRRAVSGGDVQAVKQIFSKLRIPYESIFPIPYQSIHEATKTQRGRVAGSKKRANFVFREASIKAYINLRKPKVGHLESGWGSSANALGVSPSNWPAWVRRNGNNGTFENKLGAKDKPTFKMINDTKEAKDMDQEEIVGAAIFINGKKMEMELRRILEYELRKHSRR